MVWDTTPWTIYKMFNDPPGTPKELKCVTCKLAIGSLLLGLGGLSAVGAKVVSKRSVYQMMSFVGLTGALTICAGVSFRLAYDNNKYNERLKVESAKEISRKRRENRPNQEPQLA